jgi:hypothetical protein
VSGFLGPAAGFLFLDGGGRSFGFLGRCGIHGFASVSCEDGIEEFEFLEIFFGGRNDLTEISVIVITGTASHLRGLSLNNGDDCVIGQTATLDAIIVDNVTQPKFIHRLGLAFLKYIKRF